MKSTIILTVHNKAEILRDHVLPALAKHTNWAYSDLIVVLDGCTDNSEEVVLSWVKKQSFYRFQLIHTPDVFETKANNAGIRKADGDYVIILQDDCVVDEKNWNVRILEPFAAWHDVFAVSGNCAHNWQINPLPKLWPSTWSDLLDHCHHANKDTITDRQIFAVRDSVNRGPLAIHRKRLVEMGLFDEQAIFKQDMDDHDLMYRVKKYADWVCGFYHIKTISEAVWGGTRDENGQTKPWLLECQHKNMQLVHDRHKDIIHTHTIENRII